MQAACRPAQASLYHSLMRRERVVPAAERRHERLRPGADLGAVEQRHDVASATTTSFILM